MTLAELIKSAEGKNLKMNDEHILFASFATDERNVVLIGTNSKYWVDRNVEVNNTNPGLYEFVNANGAIIPISVE